MQSVDRSCRQRSQARPIQHQTHRELVYRALQFHKRSPDFIGTHDETLSVAMRVHYPNRAPMRIDSLKRSLSSNRLC
jgi:hypothetical protein